MKKLLHNIERFLYRHRINSVFQYIVVAMATIYVLSLFNFSNNLLKSFILTSRGLSNFEIWRIFTFLIIPPFSGPINALLYFYFLYFIASNLEKTWGLAKFILFYSIGIISSIAACLISGIGLNTYLNLSLLFAFALIHPEQELLLFFVIPIKMKWIAVLNLAYYIFNFIKGGTIIQINIVFSLINVIVFFGGDILDQIKRFNYRMKMKRNYRN